jgi:DNA-directed RNA polymerase subunit RPC12/RpoP
MDRQCSKCSKELNAPDDELIVLKGQTLCNECTERMDEDGCTNQRD